MHQYNSETDVYIQKAPKFARPILEHIRSIVHDVCPEVTESIKWGFPNFEYKGILCNMAAHKAHCSFRFWKGRIMNDPQSILVSIGSTGMGHFGRLSTLEDLPVRDTLRAYIREAVRLNEEGIMPEQHKKNQGKKKVDIPDFFTEVLRSNANASKAFDDFSYSNKKDYVDWIIDAKTKATREKRLTTAIEWMAEGKVRNWKYIK